MDFVHHLLHLSNYLHDLVQQYGPFVYALLFGVIFCETGLVVTPILPGDSLLFAVGTLCGGGELNLPFSWVLLTVAALMGDHSNYWIGRLFGENVFGRFVNRKHLDQTHEVYERHGVQTLVLLQFAPILRTFAPFVAGVGEMTYGKFFRYNLAGVLLWTTICIFSGYFFGSFDFVKNHFELVVLGIVFVSLIPSFIQIAKALMGASGGKKTGRKK